MSTTYYGLPTGSIGNEHLRVEFLTTAGPRLVRLVLAGTHKNLLAETPDGKWDTPYGEFQLYGGHRLWYAPEVFPRSSFPDNQPVAIEELADGVCLKQPAESISGIIKSIALHLAPDRPELTLVHRLQNAGTQTREIAPWSITQLPLGGVALLPQSTRGDGLGPNRNLALWPYARWTDPRLQLTDEWIKVQGTPRVPPLKLGHFNRDGWMAYVRDHVTLVKRFEPQLNVPHPDLNCNAEVYVNGEYIELETLGPLTPLAPGQTATLVEHWELYEGRFVPDSIRGVQAILRASQPVG